MAKILGGKVTVPNAECALQWHALLSFTLQHAMVYNLTSRSDFGTLRAVLPLIARDFPGKAMSEALDAADSAIGGEDIRRIQAALDNMLGEIVPGLMKGIIDCECGRWGQLRLRSLPTEEKDRLKKLAQERVEAYLEGKENG